MGSGERRNPLSSQKGAKMRYYFSHEDKSKRISDIMNGDIPKKIRLYAETDEIVKDFETNPVSDWWGVYRIGTFSTEFADFDSREDAEQSYYETEAEDIYCKVHNC